MNFSMQITLPFLLTLLQIFRAAWIPCPLLLTKKTEVLSSVVTNDLPALSFSVHGDTLSNVQEFTYLGNILSVNCSLDSEVEHRIKAASSAFGRLIKRVFLNHNHAIPTKVAVYRAVCVSDKLYGLRHGPSIDDTLKGLGLRGISHPQSAKHPWQPMEFHMPTVWMASWNNCV